MDIEASLERANWLYSQKSFNGVYDLLYPIMLQFQKSQLELEDESIFQVCLLLSQSLIELRNPDFYFQVEEYFAIMKGLNLEPELIYLTTGKGYVAMKGFIGDGYDSDHFLRNKYKEKALTDLRKVIEVCPENDEAHRLISNMS